MSKQSEDQALQTGHDCAMAALSAQKSKVAALSQGDRLQWWIGFLTAGMGAAQVSVGEVAFRALRRSLADELDGEIEGSALAELRRLQAGEALEVLKTGTYTTSSFEFPRKKT
ncbi:MAG TPA: hypothetical protein VHY19_05040 [Steroidobacteraceae bacterium]|jgi:hypothetical protein|nr:hypothetical protein [Steroidobacteraceae bacterium]